MFESPTTMALGIFGARLFLNIIDITVIPLVESLSVHSPHGALNNGAYFWNYLACFFFYMGVVLLGDYNSGMTF